MNQFAWDSFCEKMDEALKPIQKAKKVMVVGVGSTMAAARSSETLGCDRGHPSKNFYKPKRKRLSLFLKDNLLRVSQESAQGQGKHLDALALLGGCNIDNLDFGKILQNNYSTLFKNNQLEEHQEFLKSKSDQLSERILSLMSNSPLLSQSCKSS